MHVVQQSLEILVFLLALLSEYKRGISGWNFNLEDVKAQASLIQDAEDCIPYNNLGGSSNSLSGLDHEKHLQSQCSSVGRLPQLPESDDNDLMRNFSTHVPSVGSNVNNSMVKCDKSDDDSSIASPTYDYQLSKVSSPCHDDQIENNLGEKHEVEINGKSMEEASSIRSYQRKGSSSGSNINLPDIRVHPVKGESDKLVHQLSNMSTCNGIATTPEADDTPTEIQSGASIKSPGNNDELDEKAKGPVVQQRGRFKVTSENVDVEKAVPSPMLQKSHSMQVITQHSALSLPSPSSDAPSSNHFGPSLYPTLHHVLQTNIIQRDSILHLMKHVSAIDSTANYDGGYMPTHAILTEKSLLEAAHEREKELIHEVTDLQWRLICAQEELQKYKTENDQV